ncbi:heterokaryon incompatibility protein-domain-containing protein [Pisolithus orientalis]|uniref:heterokaryon incompatibility protein-domain-containing protein n=1 Tax=Pisolithus orientalis TaxID=936130 RepID=UPI0022250626|nr:heterokaryon incompatibility protein-domain-containing protein [Pisolithus orientalis]KAI5992317.1 heterokaryon incompatibility protein-domain-containing protein [Pisolithus orientalis]
MRLLDADALLCIETSIDKGERVDPTTKILAELHGNALIEKGYAILSHCWGEVDQEVSFKEVKKFLSMTQEKRNEIRERPGYQKIILTCRQAQEDGLKWVWVDTCCINKDSSAELSEAINSMYQWYESAEVCYAYLHDAVGDWMNRGESMLIPRWFSRGWTLQELIAPKVVYFFDRRWECIGDREKLADILSDTTRIPKYVLKHGLDPRVRPCVAQVISWAADRTTTREEDRSYSLLGLLKVHMPMLYGEGKNAFRRLQLEIIRTSNDQSIFAWGHSREFGWSNNFLADDPSYFSDCGDVELLSPDEIIKDLEEDIPKEELSKTPAERFRTFTVTNDGIQMWLPTTSFGPLSEVKLACRTKYSGEITIRLALFGSTSLRIFAIPYIRRSGKLELKQHFLPYKAAEYPTTYTSELREEALFHCGFVRDRVLPDGIEVRGNQVSLSKDKDFAAIAYICRKDKTRFLVLLRYCAGRHSAFATLCPENLECKMAFLRFQALEILFNSQLKNPRKFTRHIHLRRSIEDVSVMVNNDWRVEACFVAINITNCPGMLGSQVHHPNKLTDQQCLEHGEVMEMLQAIIHNFSVLVGWVSLLLIPFHIWSVCGS